MVAAVGSKSPAVHGMVRDRRSVNPVLLAAAADPVMERLGRVVERQTPRASSAPLKTPTFDGEDAVELFIRQFRNEVAENEWTERKLMLDLRNGLVGSAKAHCRGEMMEQVFQELQTRYGISVRQAKGGL